MEIGRGACSIRLGPGSVGGVPDALLLRDEAGGDVAELVRITDHVDGGDATCLSDSFETGSSGHLTGRDGLVDADASIDWDEAA